MKDFDPKEKLLLALNHFNLQVVKHEGKTIYIEKDYSIEIEGENLFKLIHEGYVISPFSEVEELCDFIKKDINLNEEN